MKSRHAVHERFAAALDRSLDAIAQIQEAARTGGERRAAAVADAHPPDAERLDRAARGRRRSDRGNVALAPGAPRRRPRKRGPAPPPRGLDAQLPPRRALRRGGQAAARARCAGACWRSPDERQPARERRPPAARSRPARLPRLRGRGRQAGDDVQRGDTCARRLPPRRRRSQRRELPPLRAGRDRFQPPRRRLLRHGSHLGRASRIRSTTISRPTAG